MTDFSWELSEMIRVAVRDNEYRDLAGLGEDEAPDALVALESQLLESVELVRVMRTHAHDWSEDGLCTICGRDGNA